MKAYEAIAQSLIAEGVTDFFGLMGDGNMWLWGALCQDPSVTPYNARHESMAVSMADGYSRTTGKIGVAMVTCGPGLTQSAVLNPVPPCFFVLITVTPMS
jgi:acetolactate synthase I/II/III large subunit